MKEIILVLLLVQGAPDNPSGKNPTLMFVPFKEVSAQNSHPSLEKGIPDILMACLSSRSDSFIVLNREHLGELAREQGLVYEAAMSGEQMARIGRMTAAQYIFSGNYWFNDEQIDIQVLTHETETTRMVGSLNLRAPINSLPSICSAFTRKLLEQFKKHKNTHLFELVSEEQPETSNHMIHGLGFYHNGEYWKAFPAFMKVLKKHPGHANARFWLGKSYLKAGMNDLARVSLNEFIRKYPQHIKWQEAKKLMKEMDHE